MTQGGAAHAANMMQVEAPANGQSRPATTVDGARIGRDRQMWRRFVRYSLVSVVNIVIGQALLILAFGVMGWSAVTANCFSAVLAAGPAYVLSRRWVWRRSGRSHLVSEVLPFWALAVLGLAVSTGAVALADHLATVLGLERSFRTVVIAAAAFGAYGVVWALRFIVLDRLVFRGAGPGRSAGDLDALPPPS